MAQEGIGVVFPWATKSSNNIQFCRILSNMEMLCPDLLSYPDSSVHHCIHKVAVHFGGPSEWCFLLFDIPSKEVLLSNFIIIFSIAPPTEKIMSSSKLGDLVITTQLSLPSLPFRFFLRWV
jgi:hypothetical protein